MSSGDLELRKQQQQFSVVPRELLNDVADFQKKLNSDPDKEDVEVNELLSRETKTIKFVPVGSIERMLDELFSGLYNIEIREVKIVANEIVIHARIQYYHPVAGVWLHRDGIGAVQIRWTRGIDITDMNGKLKNALVADAPHAYAEAIKNAAKKIGKMFGRSLNRDDDYSDYQSVDDFLEEFDSVERQKIDELVSIAETKDQLTAIWKGYPKFQKYIEFKQMILKRRKELGI